MIGLLMALEIKKSETDQEFENAYALAKSIFLDGADELAEEAKVLSWDQEIQQQLIIAKDGHRIAALARVCPRIMNWKSMSFNVAGLSSICVDQHYRGQGLGRKIMSATVQYCDDHRFDFTYLIARKKVDYFYQKFDFFGASSYPKIKINDYKKEKFEGLEFSPFNPEHIVEYKNFYSSNYYFCFGATNRSLSTWKNIAKHAALIGCNFREIWHQSKLVGYCVFDRLEIIEYGVDPDCPDGLIAASLGQIFKNKKSIELNIPHHHIIVNKLKCCDLVFTSRRCLFGGHMLRWNKKSTKEFGFNIGTTEPAGTVSPYFSIGRLDEV